jgi:hypothetical protein
MPARLTRPSRAHSSAAAPEAMRQILLRHAKARPRLKRGGGQRRQPAADFESLASLSHQVPDEIVRLDKLVRRLETESPDGAAVDRRWAFARARSDERSSEGS